MWRVQACVPPPCSVVQYQGSEVVITKISEDDPAPGASGSSIIGNSATVQLCAAPVDPWLKHDPWAPTSSGPPGLPVSAPSSVDCRASLREVETRIEQSLWEKYQAQQMEVDSSAHEARFAALEQQVQSLASHQQQLEANNDEAAKKSDSQFASLQTQVTTQIDMQGQHIQGLFQSQLQQIEALLTKRARTE